MELHGGLQAVNSGGAGTSDLRADNERLRDELDRLRQRSEQLESFLDALGFHPGFALEYVLKLTPTRSGCTGKPEARTCSGRVQAPLGRP
jgi:hypothetical protein